MTHYFDLIYNSILFLITAFAGYSLFTTINNLLSAPILKTNREVESLRGKSAKVSILIPARNEEKNIADCLNSVFNQSYRNIEVLVLNDNSEDGTENILQNFAKKHDNFGFFNGSQLPEGWLGKNFACSTLSKNASGDYFLFIDADVRLEKTAVESALYLVKKNNLSLLSLFPTQKIKGFGTFLVIPLMNWLLLNFLPLNQVFKSKNQKFVAANGQFMFFEKESYFNLGGHDSVKDKIVEDMELARSVKSANLNLMTLLGGNLVFCDMYSSFTEGLNGFSKNFYPGFNISAATFLLMILVFFVVNIFPFFLIYVDLLFLIPLIMIMISKLIIAKLSHFNIFLSLLLHLVHMVVMLFTGVKSVILTKKRKLVWKGRNL